MEQFVPFPGPEAVFGLIQQLTISHKPQWGMMQPQHMLEHLMLPLRFSRGDFEVPVVTPSDKIEKTKKIMLLSDLPLKRDFKAPFIGEGLQPLIFANLEETKAALQLEIELFLKFWEEQPLSVFAHPIFGPLTREEWYVFHSKHFTHHFLQFGLSV